MSESAVRKIYIFLMVMAAAFMNHGSSIHESWQQHSIVMAAALNNHGSSIHESWQQHSIFWHQPRRASVSRAREIQSRKVITNRAFFRRPMGGCWGGATAAALMLRRWGCARAMCPRSPRAAGTGSLRGVHPLRR